MTDVSASVTGGISDGAASRRVRRNVNTTAEQPTNGTANVSRITCCSDRACTRAPTATDTTAEEPTRTARYTPIVKLDRDGSALTDSVFDTVKRMAATVDVHFNRIYLRTRL